MAVKITDLPELTTPESGDFLVVVDSENNATKKVEASKIINFGNSEIFTRYDAYRINPADMVSGMFTLSVVNDNNPGANANNTKVQITLSNPPSNLPPGTALQISGLVQDNGTGERFTQDDAADFRWNSDMDFYFSRNFPTLELASGDSATIAEYNHVVNWDSGEEDGQFTIFGAIGRLTGVRVLASKFSTTQGNNSFTFLNDLDPDVDIAVPEQVFRYEDEHVHDD